MNHHDHMRRRRHELCLVAALAASTLTSIADARCLDTEPDFEAALFSDIHCSQCPITGYQLVAQPIQYGTPGSHLRRIAWSGVCPDASTTHEFETVLFPSLPNGMPDDQAGFGVPLTDIFATPVDEWLGESQVYRFEASVLIPFDLAGLNGDTGHVMVVNIDPNAEFAIVSATPVEGAIGPCFVQNVPGVWTEVEGFVTAIDFLCVPGPCPGDFNHDGVVDYDDLDIWWDAFRVNDEGDANGDGITDGKDYWFWADAFGSTCPTVSGAPGPDVVRVVMAQTDGTIECYAVLPEGERVHFVSVELFGVGAFDDIDLTIGEVLEGEDSDTQVIEFDHDPARLKASYFGLPTSSQNVSVSLEEIDDIDAGLSFFAITPGPAGLAPAAGGGPGVSFSGTVRVWTSGGDPNGVEFHVEYPPAPSCPADLDGSTQVGFSDLVLILATWGPCEGPCPHDLDGNGGVGFNDLVVVLAAWGSCG